MTTAIAVVAFGLGVLLSGAATRHRARVEWNAIGAEWADIHRQWGVIVDECREMGDTYRAMMSEAAVDTEERTT